MYTIMAFIRPKKWVAVHEALRLIEVERLTVADVLGFVDHPVSPHSVISGMLTQYTLLEIIVNDDFLERTVDMIAKVAKTGTDGQRGDGKIFVLPVDDAIQIYNGQRGKGAV